MKGRWEAAGRGLRTLSLKATLGSPLALESVPSRQEGKVEKEKLSPQHKWGKDCVFPNQRTRVSHLTQSRAAEHQASVSRVTGNSRGPSMSLHRAHLPRPHDLLLPVQNRSWIIKSQHTEWPEMIVLWPWEPLVWNDDLYLVAWSQLFFTAHNHNILFK